jgi:transcription initiation factor TFIIIB Brf1 subunit/transcription initiation factor TFIIB
MSRVEATNHQSYIHNRQEQIENMLQEIRENQAESDRLEQETIMMERQAVNNREIFNRQIKDVLMQMTETKQHVELHVGVLRTMAETELQETRKFKIHGPDQEDDESLSK